MTARRSRWCLLALLVWHAAVHAAEFEIDWQAGALTISGAVSSDGHAETLRTVAGTLFADAQLQVSVDVAAALPPGWSLLTEQALRALAKTRTGHAAVNPDSVVLRGSYADKSAWQQVTNRLSAALLPGMQLRDLAIATDGGRDLADYCLQQVAAVTHSRRVDFDVNGSELRSSAFPLLDALVEIAADCPAARILITGHTDASGNEGVNVALSRARAQAVVAYMVGRGIADERLSAHGAGASQPLGDNATRAGRARNRRIEFAFSFKE